MSQDSLKFKAKPLSGFHNYQDFYLNGVFSEGSNIRYGGKKVKFERPKLLMSTNNKPEYFYCPSGVALDGSNGSNNYILKYSEVVE